MSIDSKKLRRTLEKHNMIVIEYYCIDGDCAMLKCFLSKIGEYLLIYIPSALRFRMSVSENKNAYELQDIEENTENDDYSKSGKVPDMDIIDEEKSVNNYKELTKKYQKSITMDGNDEPISRKLKRQIDRLRLPFSRLTYELALQNSKFLCVSFGDSITMFSIKGYSSKNKTILFLINVNDFIDRIEDVDEQIGVIKEQFYDIIKKVSISNLESISDQISEYKHIMSRIETKKEDYKRSIVEYREIYEKTKEKEDDIIKVYKEKMARETGVKRDTLDNEYQRRINELYKTKIEVIQRGITLVSKFQTNILILEETSFDNSVMLERVSKNFTLLKNTL
jgi:hypothetical protein